MERIFLHPPHTAQDARTFRVGHWLNTSTAINLDQLLGRVVVLCAFDMMCSNSVIHALPQAARIRESFDPNDVEVIGLHPPLELRDGVSPLTMAAFLLEYDVNIPVAVDTLLAERTGATMSAYEVTDTPSLVLIDRWGRLRAHVFGRPADMLLGSAIATLAAEIHAVNPAVRGRRPRLVTPMDTAFSGGYSAHS